MLTTGRRWDELNAEGLIFGRSYTSGSVDYTLRAPSVGCRPISSGGEPSNNEWDSVQNKKLVYIPCYVDDIYSWGQDSGSEWTRAARGLKNYPRAWGSTYSDYSRPANYGYRPFLEVLNTDELGPDGLKAVTLDLNGGSLGGSSRNIQIVVKNGATFTAPASEGLTRPDGDTGSAFFWLASDGKLYAPGASVPADVTLLTAQWGSSTDPDTYTVSFNSQGGSVVDSQNVKSGETATEPTTVPTRAGFDFGGWYTNADCTTKYDFSTPVTGNLILYAKWTLNTYTVTINAGANMTLASGSANQSGLSGAMTDTVYTAADGCYFPTDYAVAAVNGISVTRNSYTQITVSGTPTANTTITLAPATAKTKEDTPTATFDAQGPDFGNLNGISQGIKYSLDGGITWTEHTSSDTNKAISAVSADKDIKVYMPASDSTKLDSDIQTIDVTKSATPTGVTGVACTTSENNDGKLQKVTTAMQYKKSDASSWTDCGGTEVTGLSNGTYYVRVKATGTVLASDNQTVTVAAYTAPPHAHSWATAWSKNETHHWHDCTAEGCDVTDNAEKDSYAVHAYDQQVATDDYKATDATCTAKATYYKSCICGAKGTETFESGEVNASNHTFGAWINEVPATCKTTGTKGHKDCTGCNKHFDADGNEITDLTIPVDPNNHTFGDWQHNRLYHWKICATCGEKVDKARHDYGTDRTCDICGYVKPRTSSSTTPSQSTDTTKSADTGDMGIALYAGMAILSLTGGAWVVNKKRKGK